VRLARAILVRLAWLFVTLLAASFLIFSATFLVPGSVISTITGGRSLGPDIVAQLRAQYRLDDPFLVQYWTWLGNVLQGDFGFSIVSREPVSSLVGGRLPTTLALVVYASLLVLIVGLALGLLGAVGRPAVDRSVMAITSVGIAVPTFVAAALLISVLSVALGWFPVVGVGDGGLDTLWHLTLPAISLSILSTAYIARVSRTSIREQLDAHYIETSRARGLSESSVIRRHALRNAALPISTAVGIAIASLLASTVVVEQIFSLPGIGSLLVRAVEQKDFAVAQAVSLILVAGFIIINTLVDVFYYVLDPRLRRRTS
jgi:peptide/nickel transport system permease protein